MANAGNSTPNDEGAPDVRVNWRVAAGAAAALMALFTIELCDAAARAAARWRDLRAPVHRLGPVVRSAR
jgi:hypothetical protein